MENNPKKSRALIITIIIIIVLLLVGFYFFFMKKGSSTDSSPFSRIFSSLVPSTNSKDSENKNSSTKIVQAGEDIKKGDKVYISGTNSDNNPVVMRVAGNTNSFGFANQDISFGEMGDVTFETNGWSNFWSSVSGFIGGTLGNGFGNGTGTGVGAGGGTNTGGTGTGGTNTGGTGNEPGGLTIPDLIANDITPTNTIINSPTTISSLITNQGETPTGRGFLTRFTIKNNNQAQQNNTGIQSTTKTSSNATLGANNSNSNNVIVELSAETQSLNGNSSTTASVSYNFKAIGIYYVQACADTNNTLTPGEQTQNDLPNKNSDTGTVNITSTSTTEGSITESNENNNCGPWTAITVTTTSGENLPDLKAGPVTPTSATVNTATKLSATITNDGVDSTEKSFSAFFLISTEDGEATNINPDPIAKKTIKEKIVNLFNKIISISKAIAFGNVELYAIVPKLQGKTSNTVSVLHTFRNTGTYYVRTCADKVSMWGVGSIFELNENNNCGPLTTLVVTNALPTGGRYECNDAIDNDRDGKIDSKDPNCHLDGDLTKDYIAEHDSEVNSPVTTYQCNDTIDNDKDGKIDSKDPNCHLDGDLTKDYIAEHDSEVNSPTGEGEGNMCLLVEQNPLVFTDSEKARLAELLRKFYLIAPTLKTEDDIYITYREMDNYDNLIETASSLTEQCYSQTDITKNPSYTGPTTRYGNPWFKNDERGTYAPASLNQSSYCTNKPGQDNKIQRYNDIDLNIPCSAMPTKMLCENEMQGKYPTDGVQDYCMWVQNISMKEYEAILNIW